MSNNFRLIQGGNEKHTGLLASMHNLRYEVFHKELKWSKGLKVFANMEFDEYDNSDTNYIVRINEKGEVDASCRIIPTSSPYMISEHYPEFVDKIPLPNSDRVWEMSRFCASQEARAISKGKVTGQIIAAAIEFGLSRNIENYVALATDHILPIIRRFAGWDPTPIGELKATPDDNSYSVIYTVSPQMLEKVREKNRINSILLPELHPADPISV